MGFDARCFAARATVDRDEFAGLHIKLLLLPDLPFVEAFATECDAPRALARLAFAKGQNVAHDPSAP